MKYTLDSLHQVETALRSFHKGARVTSTQVLISGADLLALKEDPRKVFFGVLTVAPGVTAKISYRGNEVMTVEAGSQIIEAFTDCKFVDGAGVEVAPKGQFRGGSIQILT